MKKCWRCQKEKELTEFHICRKNKDDRQDHCIECDRDLYTARRKKDPEGIKEYQRKWYEKNKERERKKRREYNKSAKGKAAVKKAQDKFRSTPENKLHGSVSARINKALKIQKEAPVFTYLPYTKTELKEHLESLFVSGMSWDNYGEWHIDHIVPHVKFPYISMEDECFLECWALSNLQPLWGVDNLSKGCRDWKSWKTSSSKKDRTREKV